MYKPLKQRLPEGTPLVARIRHLTAYFRDFVAETPPGTNASEFDAQVMQSLITLDREAYLQDEATKLSK